MKIICTSPFFIFCVVCLFKFPHIINVLIPLEIYKVRRFFESLYILFPSLHDLSPLKHHNYLTCTVFFCELKTHWNVSSFNHKNEFSFWYQSMLTKSIDIGILLTCKSHLKKSILKINDAQFTFQHIFNFIPNCVLMHINIIWRVTLNLLTQ